MPSQESKEPSSPKTDEVDDGINDPVGERSDISRKSPQTHQEFVGPKKIIKRRVPQYQDE